LTIKSILNTDVLSSALVAFTCSKCPSIFNCQRSKSFQLSTVSFQLEPLLRAKLADG
jgi:hypothetical protein